MHSFDDRSAGRHLPAWVFVICLTSALVAVDLFSKSLAFKHVAGQPLRLVRDADDGTTCVYRRTASGGWLHLPRRQPSEPASAMPAHGGMGIINRVLKLHLTINTGAVFGQGKGLQWFFVVVSLGAIAVIVRVFCTSGVRAHGTHAALAFILSGALGNLYDRVRFHAVRDLLWLFPDVHLPFGWRWPGGSTQLYPWIFNVADASLLVGVALMFILLWRQPRHEPTDHKSPR